MADPVENLYQRTTEATSEVIGITSQLKRSVWKITNEGVDMFTPLSFRQHIVDDGINYIIKIQIGTNRTNFIHLKTFVAQTQPCNMVYPVVSGMRVNKTLNDPIEVFNV